MIRVQLNQAIDQTGYRIPNATAFFHLSGNPTIPVNVYYDDAADMNAGAELTANGGGQFLPVFLKTSKVGVFIKSPQGEVLYTGDPITTQAQIKGGILTVLAGGVVEEASVENDAKLSTLIEYCRENDLMLDGEGKTINLSTPLPTFTADSGTYAMRNIKIVCLTGDANVSAIKIQPTYPPVITSITVDAHGGDNSFTVADASGLSANQRIMIISNETMYAVNSEAYCKVTHHCNIKRIDGNVVTIFGVLPFHFLASTAPKILTGEKAISIDWDNISIKRGGVGHICAEIFNANIECFNVHVADAWQLGAGLEECTFSVGVNLTFKDILFSYPVAFFGCDEPKVDTLNGDGCRHMYTFSRGSGFDAGGGDIWRTMGQGGYIRGGVGTRLTNSIGDSHPGHWGGQVSNLSGQLNTDTSDYPDTGEVGQLTDGITTESSGPWVFENITINGAHAPFSVQFYGDPPGVLNSTSISINRLSSVGLGSGAAAISIENRATVERSHLFVNVGCVDASAGGLVSATSNISGNPGGSIDINVTNLKGKARGAFGVYAEAVGYAAYPKIGKVRINIQNADIDCVSSNGNHMAICGYGASYTNHNAGETGCEINIGTGRIERSHATTTGLVTIRAYDTGVTIGPEVEIISGTGVGATSQLDGTGFVKRLSSISI
ncbi:MAG: hypothetical protein COB36_14860 [Alphaproteobacteria bacterium]|nr:MAG: hypothetical protein COB36_14860 [Alphaproteobacteria bacterium]